MQKDGKGRQIAQKTIKAGKIPRSLLQQSNKNKSKPNNPNLSIFKSHATTTQQQTTSSKHHPIFYTKSTTTTAASNNRLHQPPPEGPCTQV
jgi:hypothetical protein